MASPQAVSIKRMKIRLLLCGALLSACSSRPPQVDRVTYDQRMSLRETSLAGQDRDHDGIRDDLAAAITSTFKAERRAALLRYVQATGYLVTAQTTWELTQAARQERRAAACMRTAFGAAARQEMTNAQLAVANTPRRLNALRNADRRVRTLNVPAVRDCPALAAPSAASAGTARP